MDDIPLLKIVASFTMLLSSGAILCLPLYKKPSDFLASPLWRKVRWWIPIFIGFLAVLYTNWPGAIMICLVLSIGSLYELRPHIPSYQPLLFLYAIVFNVFLAHLPLGFSLVPYPVYLLTAICFCSALSDVCAFFFGRYLGRYPLPAFLNPNKYWEGVFGQIFGGIAGAWLISFIFNTPPPWILGGIIGLASACGDLMNSAVKRQLHIKEWSHMIPGHGGILDRFASLSFAIASGVWYALLIN